MHVGLFDDIKQGLLAPFKFLGSEVAQATVAASEVVRVYEFGHPLRPRRSRRLRLSLMQASLRT